MRRTDWRGRTVGILYSARAALVRGLERDALSEADTLRTVEQARRILRTLGLRVVDLGLRGDARAVLARLARRPPDVVLNLCDAPLGDVTLEPHVPAALELLGVPCTGAGPAALDLCRHKPAVKERLAAAGIPTPAWTVVVRGACLPAWNAWPALVKPAAEDASCGIDRRSVVRDRRALQARIAFVHRRYREPALVERFIGGRELNVALVGGTVPRVLPYGEIDFSAMPAGRPRIVTFDAKWRSGGAEDRGTRPIPARPLPAAVHRALRDHALAAWHITGVRDYARVDFRLDERGRPFVLEVNPNPDLSPEAGLARAWARNGGDWPGLLLAILEQALRRRRRWTVGVETRSPLPPLLVDRMLGRLARWLRLLGADAEARTDGDDDELLARLRGSGRTLVTRHRRRAARLARLGLPVLPLAADDLGGQLRETFAHHALPPPERRFTRCGRCNALLRPAPLAEVAAWVPVHVARTQTRFARCPSCGRVYWPATQPQRFARDLARFLGPSTE
ncbi:MAG: hypothetical protein JXB32_07915 [Deltaproteobacteria bacterium]|nr:hypothetical protein [Deltaproteobacteria bacterium]